MKTIILFLLLIFGLNCFGQITPGKVVRVANSSTTFNETIPRGTVIFDANTGRAYIAYLGLADTKTIATCSLNTDIVELSNDYPNVQTLTVAANAATWDYLSGVNAKVTLTGNVTITLSNLVSGQSGTLSVANDATARTITFSGYTNKINPIVRTAANQVTTSGGSKYDLFSWYYDGTYLFWNGSLNYN